MLYFTPDDYRNLVAAEVNDLLTESGLPRVHHRLLNLGQALSPRIKQRHFDLHLNPEIPGGVTRTSACAPLPEAVATLTYMRSAADARLVETAMGRDALSMAQHIEARRHAVIEVRLSPEQFVVELVVSPEAWYDQQNFFGKMSSGAHRDRFYDLLSALQGDYVLGFWRGIQLTDTHLSAAKLPPAPILFEYYDTFAPRRDWLRIGRWYDPEDSALQEDQIVGEVFRRIGELYALYIFIAWSDKNNFRSLYTRSLKHSEK